MRVIVTFRHVNPSAGLRRYAEEKIARVEKFARGAVEAHVILSVEKQRQQAEIQIVGKGVSLNAKEETGDLYSAIDLVIDKVERQLKKRSAKEKARKRGVAALVVSPEESEPPTRGAAIRTQHVTVKPMSVADAVLQLKKGKTEFLLFRNTATDIVSVLYRRKDGNFGLVEPEPS